MDQPERRAFVQFTTGCPHLPPTGLAALNPMLSVSLKHCPDGAESELPSASTCFHVLKMPAYTSKEALSERLGYAIANSKGLIDMS
ncbi:hypothetical protein T492DRAFT_874926 [Pavlovales sp. CCMP2436]|nr:hypothetical protein T492DRAFT_874926 [Pavlovales sp. CCMP2436]